MAEQTQVAAGAGRPVTAAELLVDASWRSFTAVQGGLVVGHLLDAAVAAADAGSPGAPVRPCAVTAHLVGPVAPGRPAAVRTHQDRAGATASTRAEVWQDDRLRALAQVLTTSTRPGRPVVPALPPVPARAGTPADGTPFAPPLEFVPVSQHLEMRMLDGTRPEGTSAEPWLHAWVRLLPSAAGLPPLVGLCVVLDALPPSVFATGPPVALATVELSAHLWRRPTQALAWLRVDQRTAWASEDVVVDDVVLHDEDGGLLCVARQTRRVPTLRED